MTPRPPQLLTAGFICAVLLLLPTFARGEPRIIPPDAGRTIARCGEGWLEEVNGYPVLHVRGTPYEMGYQHGALLREHVRENMANILEGKASQSLVEWQGLKVTPAHLINLIQVIQKPFVPPKYFAEMRGVADGAGLSAGDIRTANFLPELFHCSGFALMDSATKNGTLYHGRVLDYAIDWGLQEHAVIVVAEPEGGIPFVNVTYAGFIGSVTGMNARHVSIGEMGGGGFGHWDGVPMALLVREVLETAGDLDEAIAVFRENRRTCEYFYVIADAKTNRAVGMEASWDTFFVVKPGEAHELLPRPVRDCALLSAGDRYEELVRRARAGHGKFTAESALALMDRGVAMRTNLHNVLFEPKTTRFWVANATADRQPAATQPYHEFRLSDLLDRRPAADARTIPFSGRSSGPTERID